MIFDRHGKEAGAETGAFHRPVVSTVRHEPVVSTVRHEPVVSTVHHQPVASTLHHPAVSEPPAPVLAPVARATPAAPMFPADVW